MNGSHLVKISRRRGTKYTFTIKRNITIVRGDSGTGKTTLFDMVADYMRTGEQSGVSLQCDCPCVALTDMIGETSFRPFMTRLYLSMRA